MVTGIFFLNLWDWFLHLINGTEDLGIPSCRAHSHERLVAMMIVMAFHAIMVDSRLGNAGHKFGGSMATSAVFNSWKQNIILGN